MLQVLQLKAINSIMKGKAGAISIQILCRAKSAQRREMTKPIDEMNSSPLAILYECLLGSQGLNISRKQLLQGQLALAAF